MNRRAVKLCYTEILNRQITLVNNGEFWEKNDRFDQNQGYWSEIRISPACQDFELCTNQYIFIISTSTSILVQHNDQNSDDVQYLKEKIWLIPI